MWNRVLLAPVERAEIALCKVVETNTQKSYFGKWGVVLVFEGVEMVRFDG